MKSSWFPSFALPFLLVSVASAQVKGDPTEPLGIGSPAPAFDLPGIDGKRHTLADYASADVLMLLFTCNHCPTAHAYEGRVKKLVNDYKEKSFAMVAISPNSDKAVRLDELGYSVYGDSLEDMVAHAKLYEFNYPYLYDGETQSVSKAYGVLATPHVYLFDKERKLRYQGRIDDNESGTAIKSHDARAAIDALLAGTAVPKETTRVFGCSTKWASKIGGAKKAEARWKMLPATLESIDAAGAKKLAKNETENYRLINLWATWCGPCIAEMPELVEISRRYSHRGLELVTITRDGADQAADALKILNREHVANHPKLAESMKKEGRTTNNYHYTSEDYDALADAVDPKWKGPLPHTVLIAPGGKVVFRQTGAIDAVELRKEIVKVLGRVF